MSHKFLHCPNLHDIIYECPLRLGPQCHQDLNVVAGTSMSGDSMSGTLMSGTSMSQHRLVLVFWNILLGDSSFPFYFVTSSFLCKKSFGAGLNFSHRSLSSHLRSGRELGSFYAYLAKTKVCILMTSRNKRKHVGQRESRLQYVPEYKNEIKTTRNIMQETTLAHFHT